MKLPTFTPGIVVDEQSFVSVPGNVEGTNDGGVIIGANDGGADDGGTSIVMVSMGDSIEGLGTAEMGCTEVEEMVVVMTVITC
jgi:hypothetical protein